MTRRHHRYAPSRAPVRQCARLAAALLLSAAAAACASSEPSAPAIKADQVVVAESGAEVTLAPGQSARVTSANLLVTFTKLVSDSRCPTDPRVQCVWGGSAVAEITATPISGFAVVETRRLETLAGKDTTTTLQTPVRLVRVLPERRSTDSISGATYRIVLQVGATK